MSSCYLSLDSVDDLESIYDRYADVAKLSKFAGGIGLAYHRVRSRGSLIPAAANGHSNGIVLVAQDARRVGGGSQPGRARERGACCVYLETWHADMEEFLELRDNTGDQARRTYNLNLANWVPDLFMRRVRKTRDGVVAVRPEGGAAPDRPVRGGVRRGFYEAAEARRARGRAGCRRATCTPG